MSTLANFSYNIDIDAKNILFHQKGKSGSRVIDFKKRDSIENLLRYSQPQSLYCQYSRTLAIHPSSLSLLKRSIVLVNSYELFWAPWLADSSISYPSDECRKEWKARYQIAHNAIQLNGHLVNVIDETRFHNLYFAKKKEFTIVVKSHVDADNYWHWTFEWLPRLIRIRKFLIESGTGFSDVEFFSIGSPLKRFQKDWFSLLFPQIEPVILPTGLQCDNLTWVNPSFSIHHSPKEIEEISDHILQHSNFKKCLSETVSGNLLYVNRGQTRNGRRLVNNKQIAECLIALGFMIVEMDNLSVYEQAALFRQARIIVGPHGSAFVNMMYCTAATHIIELFGPGYVPGHDFILADSCGLHWDYIVGDNNSSEHASFSSDYRINVLEIEDKIRKHLT